MTPELDDEGLGRKVHPDSEPWCRIRLIYSITGQGQVHVSDDVRFSLRYSADVHITHELGEPSPRNTRPSQ
jgi:hypothetical protein